MDTKGPTKKYCKYDAYGKAAITARGADALWYTADNVTLTASAYYNPFTFTGRQLDILDGGALHHMHYRHRDYSPQMGRFLQHDMFGINPNSIFIFMPRRQYHRNVSLFEYVLSHPVLYLDSYGLRVIDIPVFDGKGPTHLPGPCQSPNPCPLGEMVTCVAAAGPFDCLKAREAQLLTQEVLNGMPGSLPPGEIDGPRDALRHCIGTCLLTQATDAETASEIAAVHEVCSPNSSSGPMDNHNNTTGISIGKDPDADCGQACSDALSDGDLIVLPPYQWRN